MKILFITNVPSPYRVDFFNELGKKSELTVLFEKSKSDERDETWQKFNFDNFTGIIMCGKSINTDTAFCPQIVKYLKKGRYDKIICANVSSPTGMLAIEYMRFRGIPYWIEGDGGFAKNGLGIKEKIKKHFIKGAQGYFSTSKAHDEYYLRYGAEKERIYRYPFTSLYSNDINKNLHDEEKKNQIKESLGITEQKVVLSVGQFIHRKGYDILIKAFLKIKRDDWGLYIVGGKPTKEYIDLKGSNDNIHFVDFMAKEDLKNYFDTVDLFVLPTREDIWGLVINEAMANGLPIVTTDKCIAGLELVEDGQNGYIVETENIDAIAEKMKIILNNNELQRKMSDKSLEIIKKYTFENMADVHIDILERES